MSSNIESRIDEQVEKDSSRDGVGDDVPNTLGVDYWDLNDALHEVFNVPENAGVDWDAGLMALGVVAGVHLTGKDRVETNLDEIVGAVRYVLTTPFDLTVRNEFEGEDSENLVFNLENEVLGETDTDEADMSAFSIGIGLVAGHYLANQK